MLSIWVTPDHHMCSKWFKFKIFLRTHSIQFIGNYLDNCWLTIPKFRVTARSTLPSRSPGVTAIAGWHGDGEFYERRLSEWSRLLLGLWLLGRKLGPKPGAWDGCRCSCTSVIYNFFRLLIFCRSQRQLSICFSLFFFFSAMRRSKFAYDLRTSFHNNHSGYIKSKKKL